MVRWTDDGDEAEDGEEEQPAEEDEAEDEADDAKDLAKERFQEMMEELNVSFLEKNTWHFLHWKTCCVLIQRPKMLRCAY